ncbi:DUF6263 family protein [Parafilimonas sp.]|uniref:DUF6263 family protein n=1 Tax=Parafilimonas sp. TaxID=1969739 RepID=UPI003F7FCEE4
MKKIFAAFVIVALFTAVDSSAQKPVDLKFNLKKGENYAYASTMDIETKGNMGGQDVDVKNTVGISYLFTNTGDSAGWKKLNSTITRILMNLNVSGMSINYDSDEPADSSDMVSAMLGKILGAMKNGQFMFTINEKGEVGSVTGFEEMMQKVTNAASGAGPMANISNAFSEDNFKQNIQQSFGGYPGKPVKPGDTWTAAVNTDAGGAQMTSENTYTLESVEGNTAIVKVDAKISSPVADSTATINGTSTGSIKYDIPSGLAIDGDMDTNLDMKINQGGQSMPMTTDIKMKITGKKS